MCSRRGPSRSGCASASSPASATTSVCRPHARSASIRRSSASRRSSSSRSAIGATAGSSARSASAAPAPERERLPERGRGLRVPCPPRAPRCPGGRAVRSAPGRARPTRRGRHTRPRASRSCPGRAPCGAARRSSGGRWRRSAAGRRSRGRRRDVTPGTTVFGLVRRLTSTARCRGPASLAGRPSTSTSSGPRRRYSIAIARRYTFPVETDSIRAVAWPDASIGRRRCVSDRVCASAPTSAAPSRTSSSSRRRAR